MELCVGEISSVVSRRKIGLGECVCVHIAANCFALCMSMP